MPNRSKAKGNRGENEVVQYLMSRGIQCVRNGLTGQEDDQGDILGVPYFTLEVKNYKSVVDGIRIGVEDLVREMRNTGDPFGFAIIKRPRKNIKDAYAVIPLHMLPDLIDEVVGNRAALHQMMRQQHRKNKEQ